MPTTPSRQQISAFLGERRGDLACGDSVETVHYGDGHALFKSLRRDLFANNGVSPRRCKYLGVFYVDPQLTHLLHGVTRDFQSQGSYAP